jgi:hypothetical protein
MLPGSLEEATRLLGELEFALATGIEADQTACLARVSSLLERLTRLPNLGISKAKRTRREEDE